MTPVPPSLAFFFAHAAEVQELKEHEERPDGVKEEDWRMFQQVLSRATEHIERWLVSARKSAGQAISSRASISKGSTTMRRDWWANAKIKPKSPMGMDGDVYLGLAIEVGVDGRAFATPYLAIDPPGGREALAERLRKAGFLELVPSEQWTDTIALKEIPLAKDSDLDAVLDDATASFSALSERWNEVFG